MLARRIINKKKAEKKDSYISKQNFLIYGNSSKSTLGAALSEYAGTTVLELTPVGGSSQLEYEYENFISYPVSGLPELRALIESLHADLGLVKSLGRAYNVLAKDPKNPQALKTVANAKKVLEKKGDDFEEVSAMAKEGKLSIGAVVLAECNIISSWIEEEVEEQFGNSRVGENSKDMGRDWNALKSEILKFYQRALTLPITTILQTSEYLPHEKQKITNIVPNFCIGSAARQIFDSIGNVFYSTYEDDKYKVYVKTDQKRIYTKQKIEKVKSTEEEGLPMFIDVTHKPMELWKTIDRIKVKPKKPEEK